MKTTMGRMIVGWMLAGWLAVACLDRGAGAQEAPAPAQPADAAEKPAREPIYDPAADARADLAEAMGRARLERKRVLVTFGGNWCGWCYKLHDLFEADEEIARLLRNEYVPVRVDVETNKELLTSFGADNAQHGVPFLVVLEADGAVVVNQNTGDLEAGEEHDPAKVRSFLERWALERQDAQAVLGAALAHAKSDDKRVLLHFGAPWCGWCGELERFLHRHSALFDQDYVVVKVDTERMDHGAEILAKYRAAKGGIPWFAVLTPDGEAEITSDKAGSNIGYPVAPEEIAHFLRVLESTRQRLTDGDLTTIRAALEARAKELRN